MENMDFLYLVVPLLLLGVVLAAVWLDRWSVPVILVALGVGIAAGSDVLGIWHFDNVEAANNLANAALVFILFHGGLATKRTDFKAVALPAGGMATWGVILTAATTFAFLHFVLGWETAMSLLLAVLISSTDAAATFSILRRQSLPSKLSSTIEIESAANDPMAILLTLVVVEGLSTGSSGGLLIVPLFLWKFLAGPLIGWLMARGALAIFNRLNPQERGYYYVLLLAVVLLTYGVSELAQASGMLAAFTAGFVMGNQHFIYKQGIRNFSAALSMIANIGVFVMMGLLVFPRQWSTLWINGIILFLVLTFIARPAAVWLGTIGMKIGIRERHFMCWAGLRGAVPIVLATYPMAAGLPIGEEVFNLVFFAVLLSISMQGSTLGVLARRLGLSEPARPQPRYGLELVAMAHSDLDLFVIDLPGPQGRPGQRIRDLALPPRALITLITRGREVVAPTGHTRLLGWDQVTVLARADDEESVRAALLQPFERPIDPDEPTSRILDVEPILSPRAEDDAAAGPKKAILIGHGRVGAVLAGFLRRRQLPFIVIEQDLTTVERLRRAGVPVIHGEGGKPALLESAGIADARLLLITSAEPITVRRAVEYARQVNPAIEIVIRVHQPAEFNQLCAFPQTQCIYGEMEIAYAMARLMLLASGVSVIETEAILMDARRDQSGLSIPRTRITEIHVPTTSPALGKKLSELGLPRGTLLITISRNDEFVVPNGQTEILADDALLVLADTEAARRIEQLILPAPADAS
ncbi:potassium/proton antiporter [Trichloromonas acetexigens]|uniref:Potassium/proton antiporter n=1 Tax=Trichloromonas acetexigens TaxID=38815 RepID=A0A550JKG7_9BACT|nr:potassium/proton antiporter [Desulfuromonas acetexigens]TRO83709.1 potassium/proton antiporter [Desulfuromonas acetexigens]